MAINQLGDLLVSKGLISSPQLQTAEEHRLKFKTRIGSSLVQLGHINERVLATFLSKQYGVPAISLDGVEVPSDLVKQIPLSLCEKYTLVPLTFENNKITIAIADPTHITAIDDIRFLCNRDVVLMVATESAIRGLIEKAYSSSTPLVSSSKELESDFKENTGNIDVDVLSKEEFQVEGDLSGQRPVIRIINKLFSEAIKRKASDIHIEPFDSFSRVRFRQDGALHEVMRLPPQMKTAAASRIKVMAQLDISEKRLPQDGRIQVRTKNRQIDMRVSVLPTLFGEKVVIRLLDQGATTPKLIELGFEKHQLDKFMRASHLPYGMILVTGPTGSGKTTSLYAMLSELNVDDTNISTVEDPVEYNMSGINQVQVKESIGMTFASALRSLLRQDPDIIMVGEIRDHETAEIAVKSALTGHMVFSTVHTNDAPSAISRLMHMGLEPFLITASLTLVQAQRLVRVICPHCVEPDTKVTAQILREAEMPETWISGFTPKHGKGCDRCGKTGYKGRLGIFEVMPMTENIRNLVIKGSNSDQIKKVAIAEGMLTLRQSALMKLYQGITTLEEVLNNSKPDGEMP